MSVVGFDDLPEARWAAPAPTAVRQPLAEVAAAGQRDGRAPPARGPRPSP
ncbi:hypothetical protein J2Z21_000971 [Streptomyces griseochromogenes]|uniref:Uncharacterized protein n=1 Tax=Streptomyces griseochromogenes TaxID=68214 RepID=A0ABS4LL97_9ACTN|nr:hypothetical protein [Streptomyces griseochromogenes]